MDWTISLFLTHLIPYILIPVIMWIFFKRQDYYKEKVYSVQIIQLSLIFLVFSMLFEFLWHHFVQNWNYQSDFHIFNLLMYVLMQLGFFLMSIGFLRNKLIDIILLIGTILTPLAYFIQIKEIIWLVSIITMTILVLRIRKILEDNRIFLFIFFSVGVNLFFIMILFITNEPIFHILHDLLGTLLGFAIFGYLVWINPNRNK